MERNSYRIEAGKQKRNENFTCDHDERITHFFLANFVSHSHQC